KLSRHNNMTFLSHYFFIQLKKINISMKIKIIILASFGVLIGFASFAQKIKVTSGDLGFLKGQTTINVEYNYDNMGVGKFDKEEDYINQKVEDYNKKEAGRGDKWKESW